MHQIGVEIGYFNLFVPVVFQGKCPIIKVVKSRAETTEHFAHGDIHNTISVVNGRVENEGPAMAVGHKVAAPQVAVQQSGFFIFGKYFLEMLKQLFELCSQAFVHQTLISSKTKLYLQAFLHEKVHPLAMLAVRLLQ